MSAHAKTFGYGKHVAASTLIALALVATPVSAAPYDQTFQEATQLEADGQFNQAVALIATLSSAYPQDFSVALYLGWLNFQAEAYPQALTAYRQALSLAPDSTEARLGEGWTLLRLGRETLAREVFSAVLAVQPKNTSAQYGLSLTGEGAAGAEDEGLRLTPSASVTAHTYSGHPAKTSAVGTTVSIDAAWDARLTTGLTLRATAFSAATETTETLAQPPRPGQPPTVTTETDLDFTQQEVYARAGWQEQRWGAAARVGWVNDNSSLDLDATVIGFEGRLSTLGPGHAIVDLSASIYADTTVLRAAPSYRLELGDGWFVQPGASLQRADDQGWAAATAQAGRAWTGGAVWVGAKTGREFRPAYLDQPSVYNIEETITGGAWAGGQLALSDTWSVTAAYQWQRLSGDTEDDTGTVTTTESDVHLLTLGLGFTF